LNDTFIDANIRGQQGTVSKLSIVVDLTQDGFVEFGVRVDAEVKYDKLVFNIGEEVHDIPNSLEYEFVRFNLTAGTHELIWSYVKDKSYNVGEDTAQIFNIEVSSLHYHSRTCTLCPEGWEVSDDQTYCSPCPMNYYAEQGMPKCLPCDSNTYSFRESGECRNRPSCTNDDYHYMYTECKRTYREKEGMWNDPRICKLTDKLPDPVRVPCAECTPGTHVDASGNCLPCPDGYYSHAGEACQPCEPFHYSPPSLHFASFDPVEWHLVDYTTQCHGECGSSGWRFMDTYLDSGIDHVGILQNQFNIHNVTFVEDGFVQFNLTFNQPPGTVCYLDLFANGRMIWSSYQNKPTVVPITKGNYKLTWEYLDFTLPEVAHTCYIQITYIELRGVEGMGTSNSCSPCPSGTEGTAGAPGCKPCKVGQRGIGDTQPCLDCPANTYSVDPSLPCRPCGPGTNTPAGSSTCSTNDCKFYSPDLGRIYDLNPLNNQNGSMWGPIRDDFDWEYFVNFCEPRTHPHCVNADGELLEAFTCIAYQSLWDDHHMAVSVSKVQGYKIHYEAGTGEENGITVVFQGENCGGHETQLQEVHVAVICNPDAGIGSLAPEVDFDSCHVYLVWESMYGCHLCGNSDMIITYSDCVDGEKTVTYSWMRHKRCVGSTLPPPKQTPCDTSDVVCRTGEYLSVDGGACLPCDGLSISLGTGHKYMEWQDEDVAPFFSYCQGEDCHQWVASEHSLQSNGGSPSVLNLYITQLPDGVGEDIPIQFEAKISSSGDAKLEFFIDSIESFTLGDGLAPGYHEFKSHLHPGPHILSWKFTSSKKGDFARLTDIITGSTTHHLESCTRCPAPYYANDQRDGCLLCPRDHEVDVFLQHGGCKTCPLDEFSLPGMHSCAPRPSCDASSYTLRYSNLEHARCRGAAPTQVPLPVAHMLEPYYCNTVVPLPVATEECIRCPRGLEETPTGCSPCKDGYYFDETTGACVRVSQDHVAQKDTRFFWGSDGVPEESSWPSRFHTYCSGPGCGDSEGWRWRDNIADSGLYFCEVDSVLQLKVSTIRTANFTSRVSFTLIVRPTPIADVNSDFHHPANDSDLDSDEDFNSDTILSPPDVFVKFYVNGKLKYSLASEGKGGKQLLLGKKYKVSIKLKDELVAYTEAQDFTLTWVYSQNDAASFVELKKLLVTGDVHGINHDQFRCPDGWVPGPEGQCIPCPAGTHEDTHNYGHCVPCPLGQVSKVASTECTTCKLEEKVSADHTSCYGGCVFGVEQPGASIGKVTYYDLSSQESHTIPFHQQTVEMDLCNPFHHPNTPNTTSGYIFLKKDKDVFIMGSELSFQPVPPAANKKRDIQQAGKELLHTQTFSLVYTDTFNVGLHPPGCSASSTVIDFYCMDDLNSDLSPVVMGMDDCTLYMQWNTAMACPMCTLKNFKIVQGACQPNGRSYRYYLKTSVCFGHAPLASSYPCDTLTVDTKTGIIIVSIAATAIFITVIICLVLSYKHHRISSDYEKLVNSGDINDNPTTTTDGDGGVRHLGEGGSDDRNVVELDSVSHGRNEKESDSEGLASSSGIILSD